MQTEINELYQTMEKLSAEKNHVEYCLMSKILIYRFLYNDIANAIAQKC